jgi:glucose-6-phosphate-specific signal transduction histidine kinase
MSFWFGFFAGVGVAAYLMVLNMKRTEKTKKDKSGKEIKGEILYLNVMILDKEQAVKANVATKVTDKIGTGFYATKIANRIASRVAASVSDATVATQMATKMSETMPLKMAEMGLTTEVTKVFQKDAYIVLKIGLIEIDMEKMLLVKAGEKQA